MASLQTYNLPFSASRPETTSTLFLAAEAFANVDSMPVEDKKRYLFACAAYLVAGGMHTFHEIYWTGRLILGNRYPRREVPPGTAKSFLQSLDFEKWSAEFWEFARPTRHSTLSRHGSLLPPHCDGVSRYSHQGGAREEARERGRDEGAEAAAHDPKQ